MVSSGHVKRVGLLLLEVQLLPGEHLARVPIHGKSGFDLLRRLGAEAVAQPGVLAGIRVRGGDDHHREVVVRVLQDVHRVVVPPKLWLVVVHVSDHHVDEHRAGLDRVTAVRSDHLQGVGSLSLAVEHTPYRDHQILEAVSGSLGGHHEVR